MLMEETINDNGRGRWSGRREECRGVGTDAAAVLKNGNWRRTNRCVGGGQHFKTIVVNVSVHEGPPPHHPRLLGGESEHAA